MTVALCLQCGSTKIGALCNCPACGAGSTGNFDLDITFSDHNLSPSALKQFGKVIRAIAARTDDPELRFYTFLAYVTRHHPEVLSAKLEPEMAKRADALLAEMNLPPVKVRKPLGPFWTWVILLAGMIAFIYAVFFDR